MDACGTEPVTQGLNPASQLTTLVNTRVPAGREELLCSAERLEELANDCEALYQEAGTSSDQVRGHVNRNISMRMRVEDPTGAMELFTGRSEQPDAMRVHICQNSSQTSFS